MLTAFELDLLPGSIIDLYEEYQQSVINDIARRLAKLNFASPTAAWQMQRMIESGAVYENALAELAKVTGKSTAELKRIFDRAGVKAMQFDDEVYRRAGLSPMPLNLSPAMASVLSAGMRKTAGLMQNMTLTTAASGQDAFIKAADLAYMQVTGGAMSYDQAIRAAVQSVAAQGLSVINFAGRKDQLDVAVRRAVLTGVNQTVGQLSWTRADELGADLVQTSAHIGARNTGTGPANHEGWQGKIFSRSGMPGKYPDFRASTGYGTGAGLMGYNCRHSYYPFFEGVSEPAYSQAELDSYANKKVRYNGEEMPIYQATQKQREIERHIREWKRRAGALQAANLDASREVGKVRLWQARMRDFTRQTGLSRQSTREQVFGFDARAAAKVKAVRPAAKPKPKQAPVTLASELERNERATFKQSTETAVVLDANGREILRKGGTTNSVLFTDPEVAMLKGHTMTHNHPGGWKYPANDIQHVGNSFSPDDIIFAANAQLAEVRAVTPIHIFSMKPGPQGWPLPWMVETEVRRIHKAVFTEISNLIQAGTITVDQANAVHCHIVNQRLAKHFGFIYNQSIHGFK